MRIAVLLVGWVCFAGTPAFAAGIVDLLGLARTVPRPPALDPKRRINESNSFLKEREPEMTGEEYAIYEKVVTMLTTNVDFAVTMLEAMMNEKEPPSPAFEFILGNAYYAANQVDRAEKFYRSAATRYPTFLRAWNNLGVLYYTAGRYSDAIACFTKSVALGDRDPTTLGLLGFSLEKEGNLIPAEMAYLQAVSMDPRNSDWQEGLLRIYVDGGQFARAESLVKSLLNQLPAEPRFWLTYASVLISQQRKLEAAALLETCASLGVAGTEERLLLGDLYADQGLTIEAAAWYQTVNGAAQERGEKKLLQLARVLVSAGKLTEAGQMLDDLKVEATPTGRQAMLQLRADILLARKRWPEAREQLEMLLALAPLDGRALLSLGRTYLEEQNLPRAEFAFAAAAKIPESAYRACLELANLELKNRHYRKSVDYLEKALSVERSSALQDYLVHVKALAAREPTAGEL